jgi:NADP-dependent 3-hydroxy acid dehydrogenase YdfG
MYLGLNDKIAVVTGAGGGIGLAATRALADEGALVVAGSRGTENLEGLAGVTAVAIDLMGPDAPAELVARAVDTHGQVDIW